MNDDANAKTILLVDDDQFILVAYKAGLEQAGYRVVTAKDGDEVLPAIQAQRPDLILLDLIMPGLNGFEVLKGLQQDPDLSTIPVIVLTNLSQASDEAEARSYGATDFLVKADTSINDVLDRIAVSLQ